ncbi:hypothetical protein [Angustibacter sp. Root456]|uniref:hypothetical protein n=1 Tax=Angustibacter sp. Root456 TaxID=1736539 RepID=UPI0006F4380C|nr:hypothetical protein [Angustibacter sp. Root456]KQX61751.1 hypothetical protein ASD06_14305 [Angustibacter sp. Root456]
MALHLPLLEPTDVGSLASLVRAHGWVVATRSSQVGGVRLASPRGGLRLDVADAGSPERSTRVELGADGGVHVAASTTPPALLVDADSARTVPALPGGTESLRLDVGQRLLVLSADALDALPVSVAAVLQSLPARLAAGEPQDVLRELTADLDAGSAALVVRESPVHGT